MKFLSLEGLTYFWGKVKTYISEAVSTAIGALKLSNIKDVTVSVEEVNYLDGVTDNVQEQLDAKAPKDSPALTGTPTAPTANKGTNTDQIATTKFVQTAVEQAVIDGAPDLTSYFNDVAYDSESKNIQFKHGSDVVKTLNAAPFIKDGMVDTVTITDGTGDNLNKKVLKITFNTDSGKEAIEIPLEGIFDASNYYNKTEADGKFATKKELEDYVKEDDLVAITNGEIDALFV